MGVHVACHVWKASMPLLILLEWPKWYVTSRVSTEAVTTSLLYKGGSMKGQTLVLHVAG